MACRLDSLSSFSSTYSATKASKFLSVGDTIAECLDYLHCAIASVGRLIASAFRAAGKAEPTGANRVEDSANTGRAMISTVRTFKSIESLVTCKWLFNDKGETRHPVTVATIISLIFGRILGLVKRMHDFAVVNLGKHAARIGNAATVCFTTLVTFGMIDAVRGFWNAKLEERSDAALDLVESSANLVMHPFECGVGMSAKVAPWLGILGGAVCAIGSVVIIAIKVIRANGFQADAEITPRQLAAAKAPVTNTTAANASAAKRRA